MVNNIGHSLLYMTKEKVIREEEDLWLELTEKSDALTEKIEGMT